MPESRTLYVNELSEAATGQSTKLAAQDHGDPDVLLWLGATRLKEALGGATLVGDVLMAGCGREAVVGVGRGYSLSL